MLVFVVLFFVLSASAGRSPYAPYPDDLVVQVIQSGPLWPANAAGYVELSQTTQRPLAPVAVLLSERLDQQPQVSQEVFSDETTERPLEPLSVLLADRLEQQPQVSQEVTSSKPDFNANPWAGLDHLENYWVGSVQELPFP